VREIEPKSGEVVEIDPRASDESSLMGELVV